MNKTNHAYMTYTKSSMDTDKQCIYQNEERRITNFSGKMYLLSGSSISDYRYRVIESSSLVSVVFPPHAQRERGERGKVIGCGVHVCGRKKYLNRTLEIDSPFQTFAVGLLVEFID